LFLQVNKNDIEKMREMLNDTKEYEFANVSLEKVFPFLEKCLPRMAKIQSLFGFSIVSFSESYSNDKELVTYALAPLVDSKVISMDDSDKLWNWYENATHSWDSSGDHICLESFSIEGHKYQIVTDAYRGFKDINLLILD
jgi:hypothetical protein